MQASAACGASGLCWIKCAAGVGAQAPPPNCPSRPSTRHTQLFTLPLTSSPPHTPTPLHPPSYPHTPQLLPHRLTLLLLAFSFPSGFGHAVNTVAPICYPCVRVGRGTEGERLFLLPHHQSSQNDHFDAFVRLVPPLHIANLLEPASSRVTRTSVCMDLQIRDQALSIMRRKAARSPRLPCVPTATCCRYHAEDYSPDDNRFDLRPFLQNPSFEHQYAAIDAAVVESGKAQAGVEETRARVSKRSRP